MSVPPLAAGLCPACGFVLHSSAGPIGTPETVLSCGNCGLSIAEPGREAKPKHPQDDAKKPNTRQITLRCAALPAGAEILDRSTISHDLGVQGARLVARAEAPVAAILAVHSLAMTGDPAALLSGWRRELAPGGLLYVEVPKARLADHPLTFTRKSLMLFMERMGFRLVGKVRRPGATAGWFRRY